MGTILRTAEGAGVTGIIMNRGTVDPYNPKVIRSTMGAAFRLPFVIVDDLAEAIDQMKRCGVTVYAAHLDGKVFYEYDYKGGTAFLIGNEGNGLTKEISDKADQLIQIPMKGQVESLNAAIASTVLMYEVMRQRDWT
jgi:TrmH family RNA methyltransferase